MKIIFLLVLTTSCATALAAFRSLVNQQIVEAGDLLLRGHPDDALDKLNNIPPHDQSLKSVLILKAKIFAAKKEWLKARHMLDLIPEEDRQLKYWYLDFQIGRSILASSKLQSSNDIQRVQLALRQTLNTEDGTPSDVLKDMDTFLSEFPNDQSIKLFCSFAKRSKFKSQVSCAKVGS